MLDRRYIVPEVVIVASTKMMKMGDDMDRKSDSSDKTTGSVSDAKSVTSTVSVDSNDTTSATSVTSTTTDNTVVTGNKEMMSAHSEDTNNTKNGNSNTNDNEDNEDTGSKTPAHGSSATDNSDTSAQCESVHIVESCIEKLVNVKNSVSTALTQSTKIEIELDTLFAEIEGSSSVSEMERVVVLLCKIAHRIIRTDAITESQNAVLLQIFELGLFMLQYKDRWLSRLDKTGMMKEHGWTGLAACVPVSSVFAPARELVSLAQEYVLRRQRIEETRCDICAFALANALGIQYSSVSLLLRQKRSTTDDMSHFLFVAYMFADDDEIRSKILHRWLVHGLHKFNSALLYIEEIDVVKMCSIEISKIQDHNTLVQCAVASGSHAILCGIADTLISLHRKHKLTTQDLIEIATETYRADESEHTNRLLYRMHEYNSAVAECMTKSLVIYKKAVGVSDVFYDTCKVIDKDYIESVIICKDKFDKISKNVLAGVCKSAYFAILCKEDEVYKAVVRRVASIYESDRTESTAGHMKKIQHGWDIHAFVRSVFASLDITQSMLEKALVLTMYFPWLSLYIKQCVWSETEKKKTDIKICSAPKKKDSTIQQKDCVYSSICDSIIHGGSESETYASDLAAGNAHTVRSSRACDAVNTEVDANTKMHEQIEILSQFRDIPAIQQTLTKIYRKYEKTVQDVSTVVQTVMNIGVDTYGINFVRKMVKHAVTAGDVERLEEIAVEVKNREEMHTGTYWTNTIKKSIVYKSGIRMLYDTMSGDEIMKVLSSEEDLVRLMEKAVKESGAANKAVLCKIIDKLEAQSKYDRGVVMCSTSYISVPVSVRNITVYGSMVQKEFTGRQSLVKCIGNAETCEVYIHNGKCKVSYAVNSGTQQEETVTEIDEEFERYPLGGWKIQISVTVTRKQCVLRMCETDVVVPGGVHNIKEVVLCEAFKGILKRVVLVEEKVQKHERQSAKPAEMFYTDTLVNMEKSMQYNKNFAMLIESTTPYCIAGAHAAVKMCNVSMNIPVYWRSSEHASRLVAKAAMKDRSIERKVMSHILPTETMNIEYDTMM